MSFSHPRIRHGLSGAALKFYEREFSFFKKVTNISGIIRQEYLALYQCGLSDHAGLYVIPFAAAFHCSNLSHIDHSLSHSARLSV